MTRDVVNITVSLVYAPATANSIFVQLTIPRPEFESTIPRLESSKDNLLPELNWS